MQIGQSQLFEVSDGLAKSTQVFAEQIDVKGSADDLFRIEPVWGIDTMSVVVADKQLKDNKQVSKIERVLEDLQGTVKPDVVKVMPGMALIATVGQGMNHAVGTAARLFTALAKARVNVRMIDQGSSEQNIIVGVEEAELAQAIRAIYDEFA